MNDNLHPSQTGACPQCGRCELVNFIVDDEHLRRHADPESSGAYAICDKHEFYWYVSSQFFEWHHQSSELAVKLNTRLIKRYFTRIDPHYPAEPKADLQLMRGKRPYYNDKAIPF